MIHLILKNKNILLTISSIFKTHNSFSIALSRRNIHILGYIPKLNKEIRGGKEKRTVGPSNLVIQIYFPVTKNEYNLSLKHFVSDSGPLSSTVVA